jgi:hypothetical protein
VEQTGSNLAKRLGVSEAAVRRMLAPKHHTKPNKIQAALAALGKRIVVKIWRITQARCSGEHTAPARLTARTTRWYIQLSFKTMIVRGTQMDDMSAAMDAAYDRKLMIYFRENHASATAQYNDAELLNVISSARARAPSYGIRGGEGTRKFIYLAVLISPTFDDDPNVKRYLKQPDLDPDFKIVSLAHQVGHDIGERS